jgi:hypothetical protein
LNASEDKEFGTATMFGHLKDPLQDEDKTSILKDPFVRSKLLADIPKYDVLPPKSFSQLASIAGPDADDCEQSFLDDVCGRSTSSYPFLSDSSRVGDPICDRFRLVHFEDRTISVVADGAGWGVWSRAAAKKASDTFVDFFTNYLPVLTDTRQIAQLILVALQVCSNSNEVYSMCFTE